MDKRQILLIVGGILTVFFVLSVMMAIAEVNGTIRDGLMIYLALCGGTTRLRAGSSGICEYCGSSIRTDLH